MYNKALVKVKILINKARRGELSKETVQYLLNRMADHFEHNPVIYDKLVFLATSPEFPYVEVSL